MAKIHFLNVDEGDCSIIQHDNGNVTMIDICCGNIEEAPRLFEAFSKEAAEAVRGNFNQKSHPTNPIKYLQGMNIPSIFRYIQTHPDMDHMDGLKNLFENFKVLNFWDTKNTKSQDFDDNGRYLKDDWDCYQYIRKQTNSPTVLFLYDGASNKYYNQDDNGLLTDDYLQILSPTPDLLKAAEQAKDWNDCSYAILYCIHNRKILFCGDADKRTIEHLIENHKTEISNLDILIAPHHGRDSDKDFSFLDIMKPKLTLVGNAKCEHLAYDEWNKRKLRHIQNNQGGNILIDIHRNGEFYVSCSYQAFADKFNKENWKYTNAPKDNDNIDFWYLIYYK